MRNGKRIFSSSFKAWLVEQASKPGASVAGLAMQHGVNANQLRRWMRLQHWHAVPPAPVMLPVTIAHAPASTERMAAASTPATIEIDVGGAVVRVRGGIDAEQLKLVLDALRR